MSFTFKSLVRELIAIKTAYLQRQSHPATLLNEAMNILSREKRCLNSVNESDSFELIPEFVKACATLLNAQQKRASMGGILMEDGTYEYDHFDNHCSRLVVSPVLLQDLGNIIRNYISNISLQANVNDTTSVMRASLILSSIAPAEAGELKYLFQNSYNIAIEQWNYSPYEAHTDTIISLLQGSDSLYGSKFCFFNDEATMFSLLPIKSKVQMEAKVQRCHKSRELLRQLRSMKISVMDACVILNTVANTGLYDRELVDKCCATLYESSSILVDRHFAKILYNLGILNHRHVAQNFFTSKVRFGKINAEMSSLFLQGLAMLQHSISPKSIVDGAFLHVFRPPKSEHERLDYRWFINMGFSMRVLNIVSHKFLLKFVRDHRRSIKFFSHDERLKVLYMLGDINTDVIANDNELLQSWIRKIPKVIQLVAAKCEIADTPAMGAAITSALKHCGIVHHPLIPCMRNATFNRVYNNDTKHVEKEINEKLHNEEFATKISNIGEIMLKTWSPQSQEQINTFRSSNKVSSDENDIKLKIKIFFELTESKILSYDFSFEDFDDLCCSIIALIAHVSLQDCINLLNNSIKFGNKSQGQIQLNQVILEFIWEHRFDLTGPQCVSLTDVLSQNDHLLNFTVFLPLLTFASNK